MITAQILLAIWAIIFSFGFGLNLGINRQAKKRDQEIYLVRRDTPLTGVVIAAFTDKKIAQKWAFCKFDIPYKDLYLSCIEDGLTGCKKEINISWPK